jgi:acetolactate synthase small subunit
MLKILTFLISAENHPDVLARTVMVFHRLAIPVQALMMRRHVGDSHMHIRVEVLADPERSERIIASLGKIVHIICVKLRKEESKSPRSTSTVAQTS